MPEMEIRSIIILQGITTSIMAYLNFMESMNSQRVPFRVAAGRILARTYLQTRKTLVVKQTMEFKFYCFKTIMIN